MSCRTSGGGAWVHQWSAVLPSRSIVSKSCLDTVSKSLFSSLSNHPLSKDPNLAFQTRLSILLARSLLSAVPTTATGPQHNSSKHASVSRGPVPCPTHIPSLPMGGPHPPQKKLGDGEEKGVSSVDTGMRPLAQPLCARETVSRQLIAAADPVRMELESKSKR